MFVRVPDLPVFAMAKERGYLNVALSPTHHLLKRLAGVAGDRVTIDSSGVQVNGVLLANSAPLKVDGAGRRLAAFAAKDHFIGPGEVLLMSDYSPASFDSRYFGPLPASAIESVATPILTGDLIRKQKENIKWTVKGLAAVLAPSLQPER